ncbi:MAG TPA: DUF2911 domain-containing protein [Saprospiraceae bacterium]|nr:DUF2911 domain-containing protein [Saprospiraceae bacterium]
MKKVLFFLCLMTALVLQSNAQIRTPQPSPSGKVMQTVGMTDVTIEYSRPSMKGRTLFAKNGLVPFGEIWRTGANSATKITFSTDAKVGGAEVAAGSYAILTKPMADKWTVMLFPYESSNWGSYVEKDPAATVTAQVMKNPTTVESFMMAIDGLTNNGATLVMAWGNTIAGLPIEVPAKEMAMASIERALNGPTAGDYYAAAAYYHSEGMDLKKAHKWVKMANAEGATYWQLRLQSQIEADLKMYKEAVATAKKSLDKAKEAGNNDYIRMNEANIKKWSMKK